MAMRLLLRALLFAIAASVPLLVADAVWGIGYVPSDFAHRLAGMHWLFHGGTATLSVLGAWIALQTLEKPGPSILVIMALGVAFGVVSIVAAPAALIVGDEQGVGFWQFIGALFATASSGYLTKKASER